MKYLRKKKHLLRSFSYILKHYREPLSVKELARRAGYTEARFILLFCRYFGATPKSYVTYLRLSRARELLKGTSLPVCRIADLCGYEDEFYFSRLFCRYYGCSPVAYRKMESGKLKMENDG